MSWGNPLLAQYSELFMLLASITYIVAFCAFMWDLLRTSRTLGGVAAPAQSAAPRATVKAGSSGSGAAQALPGAGLEEPGGTADLGYSGPRRPAARVGVALVALAVLIHAAGVVCRAVAAGRVPWGNMYEFCTTGALLVSAVFLLVLVRRDVRFVGSFVTGLVLVMMFAASTAFYVPVGPLVPSLQSYWLIIHVSIAVLSSALFTITFALAVLQLLQSARHKRMSEDGVGDRMSFLRLVPSASTLELFAYRLNALAFVGWTLTLIFGAMWAEKAWGRYWGWDTKEVWTFVIWVVYAGYLHARATHGWKGTRVAWLSIIGYACVIFNFTVVNIFFAGLHSYSGLN